MDKDKKQKILKNIPPLPGVYLMKDKDGNIIYVGKAKNLKARVRSYFNPSNPQPKVKILLKKLSQIETIVTQNEIEALILEANLIKKYHPKYNVLFKDDKRYPYLKLTLSEEYPVLKKVRQKSRSSHDLYFGPYPQEGILNEILETLTEVFQLRRCKKFKIQKKPCLDFYIGKCLGICLENKQHLKSEYQENIERIKKILTGKVDEIIKELETQMFELSQEEKFEEAARKRDKIFLLKRLKEKQFMENLAHREADLFNFISGKNCILIGIFHLRDNKILGKETLKLKMPEEEFKENIDSIIFNYYSRKEGVTPPAELVFDGKSPLLQKEKIDNLKDALTVKYQLKIKTLYPSRGELFRLLRLLEHNLKLDLLREEEKEENFSRIQQEVKKYLNIDNFYYLEAFDISNLGSSFPVGAVIVSKNGKFSRKDYRKFNIKTLDSAPNDFASIEEVVERRYRRLLSENKPFPQIVLIDGGKGQLKSAYKAFQKVGHFPDALLSIAKKEEIIYTIDKKGETSILPLENLSPLHKFLIQARDEIHRFVITFHRKKRQSSSFKSILEEIEGIGPQRRKAILEKFPTLEAIKNATIEEIQSIKGITPQLARKIKLFLEENL